MAIFKTEKQYIGAETTVKQPEKDILTHRKLVGVYLSGIGRPLQAKFEH